MEIQTTPPSGPNLGDDILYGADEIAKFLFGPKGNRRRVFHLVQTSRLPTFRIGTTICARRSTLMDWIAEQEDRAKHGKNPVRPVKTAETEQVDPPEADAAAAPEADEAPEPAPPGGAPAGGKRGAKRARRRRR